jgi:uncharacterized protein (TIGR02391 family)
MRRLSLLVPNAGDLLALEAEEVAGVLLTHLNSYDANDTGDGSVQHGRINQYNFFNALDHRPEYPGRQAEVNKVLMEAWSWLQAEGFLVRDWNPSVNSFFLSRRAQQLRSREDFSAYRHACLLPKGQLHALIATKVYPAFLRGEYDTAVFQAFREVEVAVRSAGKFPAELVGTKLMREAFRIADPNNSLSKPGPLTDTTLPVAEQEGMSNLFSGAISLYKNPQSHRNVLTEAIEASEVIVFASHLLRMVERLYAGQREGNDN